MKIIELDVSELKKYDKNARIHSQEQIELAAKNGIIRYMPQGYKNDGTKM